MTASPRALMPDHLRLVALFGIVVVNVQFIAFPTPGSVAEPGGGRAGALPGGLGPVPARWSSRRDGEDRGARDGS